MRFFKKSFQNKLFFSMLVVSMIPLLVCTALMIQLTKYRLSQKQIEESDAQMTVFSQSMDRISNAIQTTAQKLLDDGTIIHELSVNDANRFQMNSLLFDASNSFRSIAVFDLYDNTGRCRYSTRGALSEDLPMNWGVLYGALSGEGSAVYYTTENPSDTGSPLLIGAVHLEADDGCSGFLVMRIYAAGFHSLLDGKNHQNDLFVFNRFFRPVYCSQNYLIESIAPSLRSRFLSNKSLNNDEYRYTVILHEPTGMYLMIRQQQYFTGRMVQMMYTLSISCIAVSILISVVFSLLISRQIFMPIQRLKQAFEMVQEDRLDTQVSVESEDELGMLESGFNRMVNSLRDNRNALIQNQKDLNEAQIRMLQAQLNPHFLCNTLDTMKWISKINKVPQIANMAANLADILRFCISAEQFVPLYSEIEILERYIEIQKIRLSDDFSFVLQIPEQFYDCMVPKMILQPIVENAILHGLTNSSGNCITVSVQQMGNDNLKIQVSDNGNGFPPEMIGRPYNRDKKIARGHLGLYNVDMILRRNYGEGCGLTLENDLTGSGAVVSAVLPVIYEEDSECKGY